MSTVNTSNITSGFIDLATYDELEKYLYGCDTSVSYFVRTTVKSSWFTVVPVILPPSSGTPGFGKEFSVNISRAGDYLLNVWLRVGIPPITAIHSDAAALRLRWCQNLMHNLVKKVCITFNDLLVSEFDSFHLDMWSAFTVPAGKHAAYNEMIGQRIDLIDLTSEPPVLATDAGKNFQVFPAKINPGGSAPVVWPNSVLTSGQPEQMYLNLPLPFFFSRDSGVALPTAALPYNEMVITFTLRDWNELLIAESPSDNTPNTEYRHIPTMNDIVGTVEPELTSVQVWANYAIVSNDERKRMACSPRDILIEQVQTMQPILYSPQLRRDPRIDLRFSHAVKAMFFAVRNITFENERSVYTVGSPLQGGMEDGVTNKYTSQWAVNPLDHVDLVYENTKRLGNMGADFFTHVNPYYTSESIPEADGCHCYSYALDLTCLDPMGSTNYGKLSNVSIIPYATDLAVAANAQPGPVPSTTTLPLSEAGAQPLGPTSINGSGVNITQKYQFMLDCVNFNIVRVSGGTLGFPIL